MVGEADGRRDLMQGNYGEVKGTPSLEIHAGEWVVNRERRYVVSPSSGRQGRWKKGQKSKQSRLRGICMQQDKVERAAEGGERRGLEDVELC